MITAATKQDFLDGTGPRHAVANDHEFEFGYVSTPRFAPPDQISTRPMSINAGWDQEILAIELQGLIDLDFDLTVTGFSLAELTSSSTLGTPPTRRSWLA